MRALDKLKDLVEQFNPESSVEKLQQQKLEMAQTLGSVLKAGHSDPSQVEGILLSKFSEDEVSEIGEAALRMVMDEGTASLKKINKSLREEGCVHQQSLTELDAQFDRLMSDADYVLH